MTEIRRVATDEPGVIAVFREILTTHCGRPKTRVVSERRPVPIEVWEALKTDDWTDEYR